MGHCIRATLSWSTKNVALASSKTFYGYQHHSLELTYTQNHFLCHMTSSIKDWSEYDLKFTSTVAENSFWSHWKGFQLKWHSQNLSNGFRFDCLFGIVSIGCLFDILLSWKYIKLLNHAIFMDHTVWLNIWDLLKLFAM